MEVRKVQEFEELVVFAPLQFVWRDLTADKRNGLYVKYKAAYKFRYIFYRPGDVRCQIDQDSALWGGGSGPAVR